MDRDSLITFVDSLNDGTGVWAPTIDGRMTARLGVRYSERVNPDEWWNVLETAGSILGQCPGPDAQVGKKTGLAIGKIQSGKTLSYTALIALAIDNGYQMTIVLGGTKKALLEQNSRRLDEDLGLAQSSVRMFTNPRPTDADAIEGVLYCEGHVLIVALKHHTRLRDLRRTLSSHGLRSVPTLVVDDEGDEASLNTQFRKESVSAVYAGILGLRDQLTKHAYVAYTATPQANLLIQGIDGLAPDFGVLVRPGDGYCGGSTFFGEDRDRYVRTIPVSDANIESAEGIATSLKYSVALFFVGAAVRHLRGHVGSKHSMLIHNSNLRRDHELLHANVKALVDQWKERSSLGEWDVASQELLQLCRKAYADLEQTAEDLPSWEDVSGQLFDELRIVEVWMVNSLPMGRDPIGTPFRLPNNILIGGNMLGRGLTIEGLAVTYITRRANNESNADTMEQRARWFGYKGDYLDLCRLFLTTQLCNDYAELLEHEEDFWESLERNARQGLSIAEWPRMLRLDPSVGLRPTRSSVANYRKFYGRGWDIQRKLIDDEVVAEMNVAAIRDFFAATRGVIQRFGNVDHVVLEDCPLEEVIGLLLAKVRTENSDWDNAYSSEYLARLLLADKLRSLDVLYMSCGKERERTRSRNSIQIMQGRSPNREATDPDYYPGDEHIHGGRVQLQVHLIRLREPGTSRSIDTTAFALFVPTEDDRFDLRYVVRS